MLKKWPETGPRLVHAINGVAQRLSSGVHCALRKRKWRYNEWQGSPPGKWDPRGGDYVPKSSGVAHAPGAILVIGKKTS